MPNQASPSTPRSSRSTSPAASSARKKSILGAVVGAVVGGVVGAVLVKKARNVDPKKLVPARLPAMGRRALTAVKDVAHDATLVAKAAAGRAANQALTEMKDSAQQFVVDVAVGKPTAQLAAPTRPVAAAQEPRTVTPAKRAPRAKRAPKSPARRTAKSKAKTARTSSSAAASK